MTLAAVSQRVPSHRAIPGLAGRLRQWIPAVILLGILVALGRMFAPVQLGGSADYVVTDGTSMLPHFKADGIVVTRAQPTYHVGDVVAYRNRQLHTVVMHRIVARDGSRFIFKGDNNDFRDSYHPKASDLIGKEWLYWPNAGALLRELRSPLVFGLLIGLLGMFAATALVPAKWRENEVDHAA